MSRIATIATIFSIAGIIAPMEASADHRRSVARISNNLRVQAARVCREVRYTFNRTPDYPTLYRCAYDMYSLASHVDELVRRGSDPQHLGDDLQSLDAQFHKFEDAIARYRAVANQTYEHQTGGRFGFSIGFGYGGPNGYHLRRLFREVECMSEPLHELGDLFECVRKPKAGTLQPPLPPQAPAPALPPSALPTPPRTLAPPPVTVPSRSSARRPVFRSRGNGFGFSIVFR